MDTMVSSYPLVYRYLYTINSIYAFYEWARVIFPIFFSNEHLRVLCNVLCHPKKNKEMRRNVPFGTLRMLFGHECGALCVEYVIYGMCI